MKVTVTGGLGFLGSHICENYEQAGHQVTIIDDRSSNVVDRVFGARLLPTDCGDPKVVANTEPDLIVHCASPVGAVSLVRQGGRIASEIMRTTRAVVSAARIARCPLINISTSEVYGFSGEYHESDACVVPDKRNARLEYAVGKLAAEFTVANTPGLRYLTIRPFNLAGPRQTVSKGFVVPTFIEQAVAGEPLTVFESGDQERAFTAVYDLADFITGLDPTMLPSTVVNCGNPANRTSINDLARLVLDVTGSPSEIRYTTGAEVHGAGYAEAEGVVKVPAIDRARGLGFSPRVGLRELVERAAKDHIASKRRVAA